MTEDKPCDVCGKKLSAHSMGAGIPICPGIYAPTYRPTEPATPDDLVEPLLSSIRTWVRGLPHDLESREQVLTDIEALQQQLRVMREALTSIAEGNLGPFGWQASYDRIREVARKALSTPEGSDR